MNPMCVQFIRHSGLTPDEVRGNVRNPGCVLAGLWIPGALRGPE